MIRHCISEGVMTRVPEVDVIQLRAKDLDAGEVLKRAMGLRAAFAADCPGDFEAKIWRAAGDRRVLPQPGRGSARGTGSG